MRIFDPVSSVGTRNCGEQVEIRIRDNGAGIPPDVSDNIFDLLFTTKRVGEGAGLAWSVSHDVTVGQHGSTTDVETRPTSLRSCCRVAGDDVACQDRTIKASCSAL